MDLRVMVVVLLALQRANSYHLAGLSIRHQAFKGTHMTPIVVKGT